MGLCLKNERMHYSWIMLDHVGSSWVVYGYFYRGYLMISSWIWCTGDPFLDGLNKPRLLDEKDG